MQELFDKASTRNIHWSRFVFKKRQAYALILATPLVWTAAGAADDRALPAGSGLSADLYVNGQPISANHVKLMSLGIDTEQNARGAGADEARRAARAELITTEVLAQAARKQGIDRKPEVADQLAFQERAILSRAYLEDYFDKNPVNDATLKTAYEWKRANGKLREYHVRHILVSDEASAAAVIAALAKGEDFVALAKRSTQDPGGQQNGGDLGWFRPDTFVDHHFSDAVESLKKGDYTRKPVRSRFGWHVVRLDEAPRAVDKPLPFDQLDDASRDALRQRTTQLKIETLTAELTGAAKVSGPGAGASADVKARSGQ